jgi:hypothetical protein
VVVLKNRRKVWQVLVLKNGRQVWKVVVLKTGRKVWKVMVLKTGRQEWLNNLVEVMFLLQASRNEDENSVVVGDEKNDGL